MGRDHRAREVARVAAGLAAGTGTELPSDLALWRLAGGRPTAAAIVSDDPARDLGAAMEAVLDPQLRRQGAHYTPRALAEQVAVLAAPTGAVVDPACGAGALLLAAADRLPGNRAAIARDLLWGADLDPLAVAVTEAAIALWSGGTAPAPGRLVMADTLVLGRTAWPDLPARSAVVGNPPFQGQLLSSTTRTAAVNARLRERFGAAVGAYVDTAALFLLVGTELAGDGGRVAMVQPQSIAAAQGTAGVRAAVAERARLVDLWVAPRRAFVARVHVCVPVLEVGTGDTASDWSGHLAAAHGVPGLDLDVGPTVASLAVAVGAFRQHHYALVGHVRESAGDDAGALVTSGLIDVGRSLWGERPMRFAKQTWERPVIDVASVSLADGWLDKVRRPKVLVASQTRVVEAVADPSGAWIPGTPVASVVPRDPADVTLLVAALCAPPVAAWALRQASGTGLSPGAIRTSPALVLTAPLPGDRRGWRRAAAALAEGDLDRFADLATAMHRLDDDTSATVIDWWHRSRPRP